ncbi:hypothetical protein IPJ72_05385 [Candidatus Peregrinibacteria bacterium]|nr:MAG: hypothetical protein IPJ72_05385 [Candidatus Peregrinibacteria bacterium]
MAAARMYTDADGAQAELPSQSWAVPTAQSGWINVKVDADGSVRQIPLFYLFENEVIEAFS